MLTDDPTLSSAQMMDGDMQVNQAAYNYNAWYQVGARFGCCTQHACSAFPCDSVAQRQKLGVEI